MREDPPPAVFTQSQPPNVTQNGRDNRSQAEQGRSRTFLFLEIRPEIPCYTVGARHRTARMTRNKIICGRLVAKPTALENVKTATDNRK
jgi:hypothetical protein